uniref:RING-type E3 ubiquitin transferase n=1 Tax=Hirondellea gigas TaxID=1518452 RepID=A0A6A7FXF4_9CRUS
MAEAHQSSEVMAQSSLFYCHKCFTDIIPSLPEYTCPRCHSGFIEPSGGMSSSSSSSSSDAGASSRPGGFLGGHDHDSDDHSTGSSFDSMEEFEPSFATLSNILLGTAGLNPLLLPMGAEGGEGSAGGSEATNGSAPAAGARRPPNRRIPNTLFMTHNRRSRLRGPERHHVLAPMLQDLIVHITSGVPGGVITEELASNPGDYAWGRGGLDAVITRLMSQLENTGPPPLTQEQINVIPSTVITLEQCNNNAQCSVCMEDFVLDERVKKLNCEHCFHDSCISPWLEMHATCPVCRKTLNEGSATEGQQNQPQPGSSQSNTSHFVLTPGGASNGGTSIFVTTRGFGSSRPDQAPSTSSSSSSSAAGVASDPGSSSSQDARMMEDDLD